MKTVVLAVMAFFLIFENSKIGLAEQLVFSSIGIGVSQVGSYIILDNAGDDRENNVLWEWSQDNNNPAVVPLFSGNDRRWQAIGFLVPGKYRFFCVCRKKENTTSDTDTFLVNVLPRPQSVIEDPALEIHIRYALKKPIGELTDEDLLSLYSLNYYSIVTGEVHSLRGVERCKNLNTLVLCLGQEIADLSPLKTLQNLKKLDLSQNYQIQDISPLSELRQLEYVDLSCNNIHDFTPLVNCKQIKYLNISYNQVSDLSFVSGLKELEELWASNCSVENFDFVVSLDRLRVLWMPNSGVADIAGLGGIYSLRKLYLDGNNICDLSPLKNLQLEWLYLGNNQIEDISALQYIMTLTRLRLTNNKITDILPLLNNDGINGNDRVELVGNMLNATSKEQYIPYLKKRGVNLVF